MMKPKKAGSRKPVSKEYMERNILAHRDDLFVNAQAVIRCSTLAEEEYENMYGIRARDLVKFSTYTNTAENIPRIVMCTN